MINMQNKHSTGEGTLKWITHLDSSCLRTAIVISPLILHKQLPGVRGPQLLPSTGRRKSYKGRHPPKIRTLPPSSPRLKLSTLACPPQKKGRPFWPEDASSEKKIYSVNLFEGLCSPLAENKTCIKKWLFSMKFPLF